MYDLTSTTIEHAGTDAGRDLFGQIYEAQEWLPPGHSYNASGQLVRLDACTAAGKHRPPPLDPPKTLGIGYGRDLGGRGFL